MNGQTIRTITIRGTSEGLDKLTGDLQKLAAAEQNVAVVSDDLTKRQISLEQAYKRQTLRLDEAARAQANIAKETKLANDALRQGIATPEQHARSLELINQRYATVTQSTQKFTQQTGLARHELINLGRQAQDVGVSLASGQSPFMVLVQQGTQIADVFATSGGTVRGFFTQAIGFAGRFVTSAAGVATAVGGIAAALLYAAASASAANKEIDKALTSGPGAASGLSSAGLKQIAQGAVGSGFSAKEATAAALEFAKTGQIYEQNIKSATEATRLFVQAAGIDAADASKQLAKALVDPAQGAQDLNKQFGFLDATLLNHIRTLQSQGKLQEAQAALLAGLTPTLQKQADTVDFLTAAWRKADQSVIDFNKSIDKALGLSPKDLTTQLDEAMKKLQAAQGAVANAGDLGVGPRGMKALQDAAAAAETEVRRLEKAMADLNAQAEAQRLKDLSNIADAFTRALIPSIEQVEKLREALSRLEQAKAAGVGGPNVDAAISIGQRQLALAQETLGVEQRKAEVFNQNAAAYQGVSASTAQTLAALRDQANVAGAVGGAARMVAQEHARTNELLREGKSLQDAMRIAAAERAVTQAQINAQAEEMLFTLQNQAAASAAVTGEERIKAQAAATYNQLIHDGVNASIAAAVAAQQEANARAQVTAQVLEQVHLMEQSTELIMARVNGTEALVRAEHAYTNAVRAGADPSAARKLADATYENAKAQERATEAAKENTRAQAEQNLVINSSADAWKAYEQGIISWSVASDLANDNINSVSASMAANAQAARQAAAALAEYERWYEKIGFAVQTRFGNAQFWESQGRISQFDPAGYESTSTWASQQLYMLTARYGSGGFDPKTGEPNAQGLQYAMGNTTNFNAILGGGLTSNRYVTGAGGITTQEAYLDPNRVSLAQRAADILPKEQQIAAYQQLLEAAKGAPTGLEQAELVKSLTEKLEQLAQATDANTSATQAMTDVLSPYYSSDPRRTHLGFRAFAGGGIMTQYGELPLRQYQSGGIATTPQVALFGEGSTPEAYVPAPGGQIPVVIREPANSNQRPVNVTINVMGNADASTVTALKQTGFQKAQQLRRVTG